ncbi:Predicted arabinose efflux permease, MFS family [Geodermatophilus saharensis]|uniref:Predicted arabinose efflux permease, MFS family n=1 Tax=Geodermatophilus saharensis TaxID=1137994 RepID=A0A239J4Y1_9ACTN|nr:MFS transporter [Geodermatophilus saharensis]SNT00880.1 Predicted arabinose efflux permease, MFS family [Geodermatophilus saharensis]
MVESTTRDRTSLWRLPAMRALVGATGLGFAGYCLTLASLPAYAVAGGASADTAGVVTAVFLLVTVAGQSVVPALTARHGLGPVLAGGLVLLGVPSPLYVLDDGVLWLSAVSAVRGAGFAVLTVLGAVLAAQVAPADRRGESIGLYGLAIAVPNLLAVPAGVALVLDGHAAWLAWLAASPVLALPLVPGLARRVHWEGAAGGSSRAAVRAALAPSVVLLLVTLAGGGLMTFLPIERPDGSVATAALLLFGVTGALTRWRAGLLADRVGTRRLVPAALLVGAAGLAVVALGLQVGDVVVLAGAAVFGAGYGAVQNLTLVTAFTRAGEGGSTAASALWNAAFDAGTAAGALVLGLVAAGVGLPWTYVLVAGVLLAGLPLARVATRPA